MGKNVFANIDLWVALCFTYFVGNAMAVSHTPCAGVVLHVGAWMGLYMLLRCAPLARIPHKVWAYLCAALGCIQAGLGLMQLMGFQPSGHHLYAMTGSFFNPAPFGAFLAVMFAVVTATYRNEGNSRILGVAGMVMFVMLPAAWSRAALLACGVCLAIRYRTYILRYWKMVTAGCIAVLTLMYLIKQGSADSRALMFVVSLHSWMKHFWLGIGVGGYLHALGENQAEYFAAHPDSAFIPCAGVADLPFCEPMRVAVELVFAE